MLVIVGATSGIGSGIARVYASQGKDLVLCARDKKKLQVIVEDNKARGAKVHGIVFDAIDLGAQEQAIKHIMKLGKVEGMILELTEDLDSRIVWSSDGWWHDDGNINNLTDDKHTAFGHTPGFNSVLVKVSKVTSHNNDS